MTMGTCGNKQHDRTTPDTVFIYKNVSRWRFFRFDTPFKGKYWTLKTWKSMENVDFWWLFRLQGAVKNFWDVVWHQTEYLKCSRGVGLSNDTICVSIRCPTPFLIEKILTPPPDIAWFGTRFFKCRMKKWFALSTPPPTRSIRWKKNHGHISNSFGDPDSILWLAKTLS